MCLIAFKDNAYVQFLNNSLNGFKTIKRTRKRPNKSSSRAKSARLPFGDACIKALDISVLVDTYNHNMGGVDIADQLSSAMGLRRQIKGWKVLFWWLFNMAVCNAFMLHRKVVKKPINARAFREKVFVGLAKRAEACRTSNQMLSKRKAEEKHTRGPQPRRIYAYCNQQKKELGHSPKKQRFRTALRELPNPVGVKEAFVQPIKSGRSYVRTGCIQCGVSLCKEGCWEA